jgi:hypothetical protein
MGRVFFLGAGFSKSAGFPLGSELLHFVRQKLSSSVEYSDKNVYLPILERVIEVYKLSGWGYFASNLELLLTSFTLFLSYNEENFIEKFRPIYQKFISRGSHKYYFPKHILGRITLGIRRAFLNHHVEISDYVKDPPIANKNIASAYDRFFDLLHEGDTIVTLNYDILCDLGLWLRNKWTLLDGYGFEKSKESLMGKDKVQMYTKPDRSAVKIYKLHGSINWAGDYEQDGIILTDLVGFFKGFNGKNTENDKFDANEASYIILPNYSRSFIEQTAILEIWRKAREDISKCEDLYFIGYSLSDIDSSLQFMLYDAISANDKLNEKNIHVIDNQPIEHSYEFAKRSVRLRFEKFLNNKCTFINKSFENWVLEK